MSYSISKRLFIVFPFLLLFANICVSHVSWYEGQQTERWRINGGWPSKGYHSSVLGKGRRNIYNGDGIHGLGQRFTTDELHIIEIVRCIQHPQRRYNFEMWISFSKIWKHFWKDCQGPQNPIVGCFWPTVSHLARPVLVPKHKILLFK